MLEGLIARDACARLTQDHLATMRQQIKLMSLLREDDGEVIRLGREFHGLIEEAAANRWAVQLLQQIRGHVDRYRALSTRSAGRSVEAVAEHLALYRALEARDPRLAQELMRDHVHRSGDSAVRALLGGEAEPNDARGPGVSG
jgi:DNA-binding GntR family transcriptional regulator